LARPHAGARGIMWAKTIGIWPLPRATRTHSNFRLSSFTPAMNFKSESSGSMRYPSKRASTACQLCRTWKTKSIDVLVAGSVSKSGSHANMLIETTTLRELLCLLNYPLHQHRIFKIYHSFDLATLEIIDRLNDIMTRQEDILSAVQGSNNYDISTGSVQSDPTSSSTLVYVLHNKVRVERNKYQWRTSFVFPRPTQVQTMCLCGLSLSRDSCQKMVYGRLLFIKPVRNLCQSGVK
jgi:hypothetical protein